MANQKDTIYLTGNQHIQIQVRHARTHLDDGKAQFTDYEIELKTNHIAFTVKNSKVRRRYSDFVWLRNRLIKDTMMTSEPPQLPSKRFFGRFNRDFIKQRQKKLQDFLFGLVKNNVYLSHTALHLFFQSKFTAEEIDDILDKNQEEDAVEAILAESECKARLRGILNRNRIGSKHDSGFSGDFEDDNYEDPWYMNNSDVNYQDQTLCNGLLNNPLDEDLFSDGHTADIESDSENDEDFVNADVNKSDTEAEEKMVEELTRMRLSSLPAPTPDCLIEDRFESSVEYILSDSTDSDTSSRRSAQSSTKGSISDFKSKVSSQESVRATPSKRKRRFSRQHSTHQKSLFNSNASLPEYHLTDNPCNDSPTKARDKLKRSKSFYDYAHEKVLKNQNLSAPQSPARCGSFDNCNQSKRVGSRSSFLSSTERTSTVKRKISLNEYIIVGRDSLLNVSHCEHNTLDENKNNFKSSL